jgi:hypothetical protein
LGAVPSTGGVPSNPKGGIPPVVTTCSPTPNEVPVFAGRTVSNQAPVAKVLYSWTTPEHVAELRRDRQLLIRSEQAGKGRGYAFDVIAELGRALPTTSVSELAKRLSTDLFPKIRYAWPHPFATRMGWPGEDYGNQLLRIVLKDEAWTARVMERDIVVFDSAGVPVPLPMALATPQRIGAIFFVKDGGAGGVSCSGSFGPSPGGATYREFIVGSEAMIEEWSLGTEEILQELGSNIASVSEFLRRMRVCAPVFPAFNLTVACEWRAGQSSLDEEVSSYLRALALPSDYYLPRATELATIVDTLEGDLFEPDPLIVVPGQ